MKKSMVNICIIPILMLMTWLLVPVVNNIFMLIGISLGVLSLLCFVGFIYMFVSDSRLKKFPTYIFLQLIMLSLWTCWSAYLYDSSYMVNKEQVDFFFFEINSYASFFLFLLMMLFPSICILIYMRPNYKWTKIIEVILFIAIIINLILQIRAIIVYPDAVRAPITAEELGYGHLLEGLIGYSQVYSIALVVPCIFCKFQKNIGKKKILPVTLLVLVLFMVLTSNLATAGIMVILGILSYIFFDNKSEHKTLVFILIVACILIFSLSLDTVLQGLGNILGADTAWGKKLIELSYFFAGEGTVGDVKGRTEFYSVSWQAFMDSPLFGSLFNSSCNIGMHSTVLDIMGVSGIFGLALYGGFIYFSYRVSMKSPYYELNPASVKATYMEFIILILFKNTITSYAIYGTMFIALPLYYYLYSKETV